MHLLQMASAFLSQVIILQKTLTYQVGGALKKSTATTMSRKPLKENN